MGDTDSSDSSSNSSDDEDEKDTSKAGKKALPRRKPRLRLGTRKHKDVEEATEDGETLEGEGVASESVTNEKSASGGVDKEDATQVIEVATPDPEGRAKKGSSNSRLKTGFLLPRKAAGLASTQQLEQSMPADAVLAKEGAEEVSLVLHAQTLRRMFDDGK